MSKDEEELCQMITVGKIMDERLSPTEMAKLTSLIQDFDQNRISDGEFSESFQLLFAQINQKDQQGGKTQQEVEDTTEEHEEGEIRQYHRRKICDLGIRAKSDGADHKARVRVKEHVSDKRESEKYVTSVLNLEGKKRRILQPEDTSGERSLKKPRMSKRLEHVSPSYRLIPEEAQCPVKDTVLNNKCRLKRFDDASGHSRLTRYEEAMAVCEDDMFETDMLMSALKSAMDTAEKVIKGEMSLEDVGVKFYRCIDQLYGGRDMAEIVREEHKKALPLILGRLKQKLDELTSAKEKWKSRWQQVFEENTAKQKRFHCKRPKENNKL